MKNEWPPAQGATKDIKVYSYQQSLYPLEYSTLKYFFYCIIYLFGSCLYITIILAPETVYCMNKCILICFVRYYPVKQPLNKLQFQTSFSFSIDVQIWDHFSCFYIPCNEDRILTRISEMICFHLHYYYKACHLYYKAPGQPKQFIQCTKYPNCFFESFIDLVKAVTVWCFFCGHKTSFILLDFGQFAITNTKQRSSHSDYCCGLTCTV